MKITRKMLKKLNVCARNLKAFAAAYPEGFDGDLAEALRADVPPGVRSHLGPILQESGDSLSGANLRHADLGWANLSGADLYGADLYGASLRRADLSGANLAGADLTGVDLGWANLTGANLTGADLTRVNLDGTDLTGANLAGVDLTRAINARGPWGFRNDPTTTKAPVTPSSVTGAFVV